MRYVALLMLAFLGIGCGEYANLNYELDQHSFTAEALKMIEEKMGIKLPEGSRGLHLYYKGEPMDPSFNAKIEIPKSAHEVFIDQIKKIPESNARISSYAKKPAWWNPDKDTMIVEKIFGSNDLDLVQVMLCKENDGLFLYVLWVTI